MGGSGASEVDEEAVGWLSASAQAMTSYDGSSCQLHYRCHFVFAYAMVTYLETFVCLHVVVVRLQNAETEQDLQPVAYIR